MRGVRSSGLAGSSGWAGHTVVVGAGPAGLTAAYELSRLGLPVTVVEKDEVVGGLARTLEFMGCRFDLGPRPLFEGQGRVDAILACVLGRDLRSVARVSRGLYRGQLFHRPLRMPEVLIKLGPVEAARCLASYAKAQLRPVEPPVSFADPVANQMGRRLSEIFIEGHRRKVWGSSGGDASARLSRGGSMDTTRAARAIRYPRRGSGQVAQALAERIELAGGGVRLAEEVVCVRHGMGRAQSVVVRDRQGLMMDVIASQFVSSMPINDLAERLRPEPPAGVQAAAVAVRYRDLITVNLVIDRDGVFPDQWIDVLDPAVRVARISNFRNFSRAMVPDSGLSGLGMEYFCDAGDELSQMADRELLDLARRELVALGLCRAQEVKAGMVYRWPKAYVVQDAYSRRAANVVREWIGRELANFWLVEGPDCAEDAVLDQAVAMASGLAAAAAIVGRGLAPRGGPAAGAGEPAEPAESAERSELLAVAGVAGYTEPAVPE